MSDGAKPTIDVDAAHKTAAEAEARTTLGYTGHAAGTDWVSGQEEYANAARLDVKSLAALVTSMADEIERMRPVVKAAEAFRDIPGFGSWAEVWQQRKPLEEAVDAYREAKR